MTNLITIPEVLQNCGAGASFPRVHIANAIPTEEEHLLGQCFGNTLYSFLIGKLTTIPPTVKDWQCDTFYKLDDVVYRNEMPYKSTVSGNSSDPLLDTVKWVAVDKFTDSNANNLWNNYMLRLLSLLVYQSALPWASTMTGANGMIVQGADQSGRRAATPGEQVLTQKTIGQEIERIKGNMIRWLLVNYKDFDGWPTPACCIESTFQTSIPPTTRRWNYSQPSRNYYEPEFD